MSASRALRSILLIGCILAAGFGCAGRVSAGDNVWTGGGPDGGNVAALALAPTAPNVLYAGIYNTVYKSTDRGATWAAEGSLQPNDASILSLAVSPASPAVVYAGTWEDGVYKSTDGGATWRSVNTGLALLYPGVETFAFDLTTPTTVYVGGAGVFKSADGGETWTPMSAGLPLNKNTAVPDKVNVLLITPTTLYAGLMGWSAGGATVYKSTDGGASWQPSGAGLSEFGVSALAIDPANPANLYAGTFDRDPNSTDPYLSPLFKSTDGGATWHKSDAGLDQARVQGLAFDPADPSALLAGLHADVTWAAPPFPRPFFKSTDGGASWHAADAGLENMYVQALAVAPAAGPTPAALYVGTRRGVFKSEDHAGEWRQVSAGLPRVTVNALAVAPSSHAASAVYVAAAEGIFMSADRGATWRTLHSGLADPTAYTVALGPTAMYASSYAWVYKSTDGGAHWLPSGRLYGPATEIATDPQAPDTVYAAAGAFYKSTDAGATWNNLLPTWPVFTVVVAPPAAPQPGASSVVYIGTRGSWLTHPPAGLYKSGDGGLNWQSATNGFANWRIDVFDLALDPASPTTLYAGTSLGLYKTTDSAANWRLIGAGLPPAEGTGGNPVQALAVDPVAPSIVYAGTRLGMYKSTDGGLTFQALNAGLTNTDVRALAVDPADHRLIYAGTAGGVFTLRQVSTTLYLPLLYRAE